MKNKTDLIGLTALRVFCLFSGWFTYHAAISGSGPPLMEALVSSRFLQLFVWVIILELVFILAQFLEEGR